MVVKIWTVVMITWVNTFVESDLIVHVQREYFIVCKWYSTNPGLPTVFSKVPEGRSLKCLQFALWTPPSLFYEFPLHLNSHPLFTLTPLLLMAVPVLSSYFPGKPRHAPVSSAPSALRTQSHFVYSILLKVWWWSQEVTSQERRQGKLNVRQHTVEFIIRPLKAVTQPLLPWDWPCSFLSQVQALRLWQGLTVGNPQFLLCCKI